jgi:hypothetical protein
MKKISCPRDSEAAGEGDHRIQVTNNRQTYKTNFHSYSFYLVRYVSLSGESQPELLEELESIEVEVINNDQAAFNPPELGS